MNTILSNPRINSPLFVFVFFAILYAIIAFLPKSPGMTLTNGDEPHYLILAASLWKDQDFKPINNYRQLDYKDWYPPEGNLEMHMISINSKLYPLHQVGIPLLILPGFILAGRMGAILTIALLTAVGLMFIYKLLLNFVDRKLALLTTLVVGSTAPLGVYSILIYPEAVIVSLMAIGLYVVLNKKFSLGTKEILILLFTAGVITIFHIKFLPLLFLILFFVSYKIYKKTPLINLVLFNLLMLLPTFLYLIWLNGQFDGDLLAGLSGYRTTNVFSLTNIPSGLLAYSVDRENGVFLFAPYYIYAIYGIFYIVRNFLKNIRRFRQIEGLLFALILTCGFVGFFTLYPSVIGGANPAGRYLLPILPALIVLLAVGIKTQLRSPFQEKILRLLITYSLIIFFVLITNQILTIPSGHESNLVNFIFRGKAGIVHGILPNFSKFNHTISTEDFIKGIILLSLLVILSSLKLNLKRISSRK